VGLLCHLCAFALAWHASFSHLQARYSIKGRARPHVTETVGPYLDDRLDDDNASRDRARSWVSRKEASHGDR
jgi:hypothetical protein